MIKEKRWDKIFTKKGKKGEKYRRDYVILYWYLLNKPDYAYSIAKELEKIKGVDIPNSLFHDSNVRTILKKMCKIGLIEQYETIKEDKRERKKYRVLPDFLLYPSLDYLSCYPERYTPVLEAISYFSLPMNQWMGNMDIKKKQNYIYLLELIKNAIYELNLYLNKFLVSHMDPEGERIFHKMFQKRSDPVARKRFYETVALRRRDIGKIDVIRKDYETIPKENYEFKFIKELDENKIYEFFDRDMPELDLSSLISHLERVIQYYETIEKAKEA